jgi:hypothetical protein
VPRWPVAAALRFLPLAADGIEPTTADVRVIWSPALFSLPSRVGFSGSTARRAQGPPSLDAPHRETVLMTPPLPEPPAAAVLPSRRAPAAALAPALAPPRVFDAPLPPRAGDRIEPLDDGLRDHLTVKPLERNGAGSDRAWEAVVWMLFDTTGWPRHVVIEQIDPPDAPPEVRAFLQRGLRAWRTTPGVEREGRVRIYHSVATAADTPTEGGRTP